MNFTHDIEKNILRMKEMMFVKHFVSLSSHKKLYCLKYKYINFRLSLVEDHIRYKLYRFFPGVPYLLKHLTTVEVVKVQERDCLVGDAVQHDLLDWESDSLQQSVIQT